MMKLLPALAIGLSLLTSSALAAEPQIPKKITIEEAESLIALAKGWKGTDALDHDPNGTFDRFYGFLEMGATEGINGTYDVNVWTGDVWDGWNCKFLSNPKLKSAQAKIKKRFTRKELKQYKKLHALKPECLYP